MRRVMIGMAGHIDHGKSALVRLLTGIDMDRRPEEKARGLTIDLGFAPLLKSPDLWVGIVDVPGHERFVRNMVAGATGIDAVCLVVAADDGVMPQTREHLQITGLLGVSTGVVALNKIDLVDADARELALDDVQRFLKGSFLEKAPIVPVSAVTGEGLDALRGALEEASRRAPPKDVQGVFRLPIQRVFAAQGFGTIVTGIPFSGRVRVEDRVEILPAGLASRVRGIQAYGEAVSEAQAGHSVALNLADVNHRQLARGDVVAAPGYFKPTRVLEIRVRVLPEFKKGLSGRLPVRFHVGTAESLGTASPLERGRLAPGEEGLLEVRLETPVVAAPGDHAILRWQSPMVTIGGGRILSVTGIRRGKLKARDLGLLGEAEQAREDPRVRVRLALERRGRGAMGLEELQQTCLLPPEALDRQLAALEKMKSALRIGTRWMSGAACEELQAEILARLEAFHKAQPLLPSLELTVLREALHAGPEMLESVLARMGKTVTVEGAGVRLSGHAVKAEGAEGKRLGMLAEVFRRAGLSPPDPAPAFLAAGIKPAEGEKLLSLLVKQGVLVRAADGIHFHKEPLAQARDKVVAACQAGKELSTPQAREIFSGVSRKHLIPLLEQFDREGLTRRVGNARFLRTAMRKS
jgi:selenocysteine-specific elongation factor